MAQPVELAGKGKGAQALGPCKNIPTFLFPFCVSAVLGGILFEAEWRGLEGPALGKGAWKVVALERDSTGTVWFP